MSVTLRTANKFRILSVKPWVLVSATLSYFAGASMASSRAGVASTLSKCG
jgi:hypothetical protein